MIKAKLSNNDLLFGLTEENIKRMKNNQPIKINLEDMGLKGSIIIMYGTTGQSIRSQLQVMGAITDKTKII